MSVTTERTVRELVLEYPALTRVLEKLGIDYCCCGGRSFEDACKEAHVTPEQVMGSLDAANGVERNARDWQAAPAWPKNWPRT